MVYGTLAIIFLAAFMTESLVEYLAGTPMDKIPKLQPYKWLLMYLSAGVGVLFAMIYKFDLLILLADLVEAPLNTSLLGIVVTGLAIGRGANYLHDLVTKFFAKPSA